MDTTDWRTQLLPVCRQRTINMIMELLNRNFRISNREGLVQLNNIAARFEEKIFGAATSKPDYLHKIALKIVEIEIKAQTLPSNPAGVSQNPPDPDRYNWRTQLQPHYRLRRFNNIMETLKRGGTNLPISGPAELNELNEIAVRFEDRIYTIATSEPDYLSKITLGMVIFNNSHGIGSCSQGPFCPCTRRPISVRPEFRRDGETQQLPAATAQNSPDLGLMHAQQLPNVTSLLQKLELDD